MMTVPCDFFIWHPTFSIISSDTVTHWAIVIDNNMFHSVGAPVSGVGHRITNKPSRDPHEVYTLEKAHLNDERIK